MSALLSPFCEYCGAANEPQATACSFCGNSLQETHVASVVSITGNLPVDTMLKGRYRIVAPLGRGGMSTVYRAQDTELNNRLVVVKEMRSSSLSGQDEQNAEAFKREATILASLQHANLPSIFEHFEEQGQWYLVMSFIQGEALDDYLNRSKAGKLPLHEVLQIGQQLCAVLHYLHSQQPPIIFRDVKPANVIRTPDGQIYLIDFGVARRFKPGQKKDTTSFGSMGYAPPEQFGKSQTTPRSDIYSLGATLYQLLSGHEPDSTPFRFPPLSSLEPTLPVPLVDLINNMLSMDEQMRPANMQIVERQLKEMSQAASPVQPFSSFSLPRPVQQRQRRPVVVIGMTILIVSCLLIGGFSGGLLGTKQATANYQAQDATAAQANATIIAGFNSTITSATNATSTAAVNDTVIAAVSASATAEAAAAVPDPYQPKGTLALLDPLSRENAWHENSDTDFGGSCAFINGIYVITQLKTKRFYYCYEDYIFTNFAFEVKMRILQGGCGGLTLRYDENDSTYYLFEICNNGSYHFYRFTSDNSSDELTKTTTSKAIHQGAETNTLAVVANGSTFDLYVNGQKIDSISDSFYIRGKIGLVSDATDYPTSTVQYQDARVWVLP